MILLMKHHVTDLVLRLCHERKGHAGARQVLTSLRQNFWILRGHAAVRRVLGKCLKCRFWNTRPCEQIMAPFPKARVKPCLSPFSSVGVDYFGPIMVKSRRSQVKRYVCVITYLTVRAVHIEIAHELTTDSFIKAFTRFVSRRHPPTEVYIDNGTNLKGAEAEIKTALEKWNPDRIDNNRPFSLVHFVFPIQIMWWYSGDLILCLVH